MYFIDSTVYLIVVIVSVVFIIGGLTIVWKLAAPPSEEEMKRRNRGTQEEEEQEEPRQAPGGARGGGLTRMRRQRRGADFRNIDGEVPDPDVEPQRAARPDPRPPAQVEEQQDESDEETVIPKGSTATPKPKKIGTKKARKLQEKEERAKIREAMIAEKKVRQAEEDREIAERKKKQQKEEELQRREEEDLERLRQERKKKEEEEYKSLKQSFQVESSGSQMEERELFENNLDQFVEYIKKSKVVYLEDLAAKHQLQTKEVVEKIEMLEQEGKLSGIIDERGKFIYITVEEMTNIAKFITQRGRVSISEIARESNKLVDLTQQSADDVELEQ